MPLTSTYKSLNKLILKAQQKIVETFVPEFLELKLGRLVVVTLGYQYPLVISLCKSFNQNTHIDFCNLAVVEYHIILTDNNVSRPMSSWFVLQNNISLPNKINGKNFYPQTYFSLQNSQSELRCVFNQHNSKNIKNRVQMLLTSLVLNFVSNSETSLLCSICFSSSSSNVVLYLLAKSVL